MAIDKIIFIFKKIKSIIKTEKKVLKSFTFRFKVFL